MKSLSQYVFFLFILFFFSLNLSAKIVNSSESIPIQDRIYDDLEVLIAHKLIPHQIKAIRPYTKKQFQKWISEASQKLQDQPQNFPEKTKSFLEKKIHSLQTRLQAPALFEKRNLKFSPAQFIQFESVYLNANRRNYFDQFNFIQGVYYPFTQFNGGRHYQNGSQYNWEFRSTLDTSFVSFIFQPRVQFQFPINNLPRDNDVFIQELYASTKIFNQQIDIGRKEFLWGLSRYGGLLISNNARPMDGIFITNPDPFKIKWIGKLRYSLFFTTLGPEQVYSYDIMSGMKVSLMPFDWLEFSLARALIFKGSGAPDASVGDFFIEYFGARPGSINQTNLSNSINGFEWKLSLPFLRNTEIYNEVYFEDFNPSHLIRSFKQDTMVLFGIHIPRLNHSGSLSLTTEAKKHTIIGYTHVRWTDGWTLNGNIIGDPLGPDTESLAIHLNYQPMQKLRLKCSAFLERLDSDIYTVSATQGRPILTNGNAETRLRNIITTDYEINKNLQIITTLGYERIYNFNFTQNNDQNGYYGGLKLIFNERIFH